MSDELLWLKELAARVHALPVAPEPGLSYSQRNGHGGVPPRADLQTVVAQLQTTLRKMLLDDDWFSQVIGYDCCDGHGDTGTDLNQELNDRGVQGRVWNSGANNWASSSWTLAEMCDVLEALHSMSSRPSMFWFHDFEKTSHPSEYRRDSGRAVFRWNVNRILSKSSLNIQMNDAGKVVSDSSTPQMAPVRNLVFGTTAKPDLFLVDVLSARLGLANPDHAVFYEGGIPDEGLTLEYIVRNLFGSKPADLRPDAVKLQKRLRACLASSPPEQHLFAVYADRYNRYGINHPFLIPQVWLYYDPKNAQQRAGNPVLPGQRMDFMLLLPRGRRVVIEVDGSQHYSEHGKPSPKQYARLASATRAMTEEGYEVYRFGGSEFHTEQKAAGVLNPFFDRLLRT